MPLLIRWPADAQNGRAHAPVILRDLVPTILKASGTEHDDREFDAVAISRNQDDAPSSDRSLHWHFPVYLERDSSVQGPWRTTPVAAVRKGGYKLIEFFEDGRLELYDLRDDPSESNNLIMSSPELATSLQLEMVEWRRLVGARVPSMLEDSNGDA